MRRQTDASKRNYGDDVEIVDVIDLRGHNMTVGDMEELTDKIEKNARRSDWITDFSSSMEVWHGKYESAVSEK